ncbi:unnamed protein product [Boreogadus saida]
MLRGAERIPRKAQAPPKRWRTTTGQHPPHVEAVGGGRRTPLRPVTRLTTYSTADFDALYEELQQLGQGGFGSVFAGCRKEDRLPVRVTPQSHTLWKHTRV